MKVPFGSGYISLEDICFQPSAPQSKECNIQSVFQYFQNNKTKLNKCLTTMGKICTKETLKFDFKAADFHDHILFCTRYCWFVTCFSLFSSKAVIVLFHTIAQACNVSFEIIHQFFTDVNFIHASQTFIWIF